MTTLSAAMARLSGLMAASSKATGSMVKPVALAFTVRHPTGRMPKFMKVFGSRTVRQASASSVKTTVLTSRTTWILSSPNQRSRNRTSRMAKALKSGQMAATITATSKKESRKEKVSISGQMAPSTQAFGPMMK